MISKMAGPTSRNMKFGFSLIEVIFAIVLSAAVAIIGIRHLQTPGNVARDRACDLQREMLQGHADRYADMVGRTPSRDLNELESAEYLGTELPSCPSSGQAFRYQGGEVICPAHP